jgi:outer membrane lipoprotein-sorting protein
MLRYKTVAALALSAPLFLLLPNTVQADEKGEALLRGVTQATKQVKSLTADLKGSYNIGGQTQKMSGKISLKRPNLAHIRMNAQGMQQLIVSNGKDLYMVMADQKQYIKQPAAPMGENVQSGFLSGMFFRPDIKTILASLAEQPSVSPDSKGTEVRNGVKYQVVEVATRGENKARIRLYVGPKKLVEGVSMERSFRGQTVKIEEFFANVKINTQLAANLFAYKPPAGFKPFTMPTEPNYEAKLLAVGTEAPPFELTRPDNKSKISLAKMLEGRKAVLVNFWFHG